MKKKVFFIVLVMLLLLFFISKFIIYEKINIEEYRINENIEKDIDNDGKDEKISININGFDTNKKGPIVAGINSETEHSICINENKFNFNVKEGEEIISFATGDVNMDGNLEILVCVMDLSISPSYRQWNIYEYTNNNLMFKKNIYDGEMKYNILTDKLTVTYSLHETRIKMSETIYYEFK